jgi:stage V sporulation protein AA
MYIFYWLEDTKHEKYINKEDRMSETLYLQINRNCQVKKRNVTLGDVASIYCKNASIVAKVKTLKLVSIPEVPKRRICFSVMRVIEMINKEYPEVEVNNIGESDFVVDYVEQKKHNKTLQWIVIAFVCLFTFTGSAYVIMAYNNDVGTTEIFEKVYQMFQTEEMQEFKLIEITYAIGLALGIIVFYNHFAGRKITSDPTPIEVEMSKYEKDVDDTMIDRSTADGRERSV